MKKCLKCGTEASGNEVFCIKCGYRIDEFSNDKNSTKKNAFNEFVLAGFIIFLVVIYYSYSVVTSLDNGIFTLKKLLLDYYEQFSRIKVISQFLFGYTLFTFIPSIIGVIISSIGFVKGKGKSAILAIILNSLGIIVSVSAIVYIIVNL